MQIGTRWRVGAPIPVRLDERYLAEVDAAEDRLRRRVDDADSYVWTLSWLEGRAVLELEDGTVVSSTPQGDVVTIIDI
ncbi:hypothetical protein [Mycetocola reblochoni]|uniref:Uncharacterized protein n=2 Tax=Mycetocola reblochoni TaxID=331618 RepID=A0A1R4JDE7_9MICO|nr:hypothetical protein [Mycetocola reblochoni]RLP69936.1 hypothetical protein D9V30_04440 [Mycetocola reblochoni]SJN30057.1 hypothetical protein FM119_06945 [Mycetocola reblochoni REB411]